MSFYCRLLALAIIEVAEVRDERPVLFSSLTPSSYHLPSSSPLHLLRASLWNMAGRKESTIGVLSSDRCPCCAFSSHCEQALGRHPHKTWKDLTCVQNSSPELQARSRSLKQTRTHAGTASCRHTTHTHKQAFPSGYKAHAWRQWTAGAHIGILNVLLGLLLYGLMWKEKESTVILVHPLCRRGGSMSCDGFNCMTDSFVSSQRYSMNGVSVEINGEFGVTILLSSGDCACLITVCQLNGRLVQLLHLLLLMSH